MEELISHFEFYRKGIVLKKNQLYTATESPKGEFGVTLVTNDSN